ncbi:hypothetical protein LK08_05265 [Streptomyces sp. MUSC 125]|uniref:chaplin n=1 Tax=Streptomyces sp. MUSC 125 TaxID=1428624 RepID=UPI00057E1C79|nr:chaplin [Streptomyces sp. MUSC 125]KIE28079.1 hypothetical protein LK08_05265 [Streptomyces sp. MUSC 125]
MRQTLSKGMVVAAAATGVLSLYSASAALADSHAHGAAQGSPGVLSGNNIQAPVNIPVNICGNSVDAAAALNPAFGNSCANQYVPSGHWGNPYRGQHRDSDDSDDSGYGDSGGYGDHPGSGGHHPTPPPYGGGGTTPPGGGQSTPPGGGGTTPPGGGGGGHHHPGSPPSLPHTGGESQAMLATSAASAVLIAAGAILYRRGRTAARR